ncbi:aldo/keto reductase family oxidoreductase [Chitinimonas sp. BJYL2]|uniref:aldo/keto reductase n=1 Tax=Chitinimonas sp. BJYL2 TaxID=2976696 RepID=UPI0022B3394C|nr:aldo/keto reductase [Chitinimonas sp. BJYL2]
MNDLNFSRLILGIWRIGDWQKTPAELADYIEACLDLGIDTFDLADIYTGYQCERLFGEALAVRPSLKQRIKLISKCGIALVTPARPQHRVKHYNTSGAHIVASAENSLREMGVEQLDMLLIHRPDPLMDADEMADAFGQLQRAGKVKRFGVSNFLPHQLALLQSRWHEPLAANQVEVSLLHADTLFDGTLDQCQQLRIMPQAWSPLGGGRLSDTAPDTPLGKVLVRLGSELGVTAEQLAIAWLLRHPAHIHPVLGTGKLDRIRELVAAQQVSLDRQQWFELLEAALGRTMP